MGGGRKNFLREVDHDDDDKTKFGKRKDGRNLKSDWMKTKNHLYVSNRKAFKELKPDVNKKVLGKK